MEKMIQIPIGEIALEGILNIPEQATGIVVFAHGSGSGRFSPRNTFVAHELQKAGLATLLLDLLTKEEEEVYETRFNIPLLSDRLFQTTRFLLKEDETKNLAIGLFGASTGAAAALEVAAVRGDKIKAVVSRGGRPDLAKKILPSVTASTLFIIGGLDLDVLRMNEEAFKELRCVRRFEIVPNATHLFEEPGCLEEVARLAKEWFLKYLSPIQ